MNNPSLNVLRPTASTLDTSSYVNVPAIPTLPVTVRSPLIVALLLIVASPVTSIPEPTSRLPAKFPVPLELIVNLSCPEVISLIPKRPPTFLRAKSGLASESIN